MLILEHVLELLDRLRSGKLADDILDFMLASAPIRWMCLERALPPRWELA